MSDAGDFDIPRTEQFGSSSKFGPPPLFFRRTAEWIVSPNSDYTDSFFPVIYLLLLLGISGLIYQYADPSGRAV